MKLNFIILMTYIMLPVISSTAFSAKKPAEDEKQSEERAKKIKKNFDSNKRPETCQSENKSVPNRINLEDWKKLCAKVHTWIKEVKTESYENFEELLDNTLFGVHNIGYGDEDYGLNVRADSSDTILRNFFTTVELELEDYIKPDVAMDEIKLLSEFQNVDIHFASRRIKTLIEFCQEDSKALRILKEKVKDFCIKTEKFNHKQKDDLMALTQHIKDETDEIKEIKWGIETDKIKKIKWDSEAVSQKKTELDGFISELQSNLIKIRTDVENEIGLFSLLHDLIDEGDVAKSDIEIKEKEIENRYSEIDEVTKALAQAEQEKALLIMTLEIEASFKQKKELDHSIQEQADKCTKITKEFEDELKLLNVLYDFSEKGEIDKSQIEDQEKKIENLRTQVNAEENALKHTKEKQETVAHEHEQLCTKLGLALQAKSALVTLKDFQSYICKPQEDRRES
jgi:hypothetical protein